MELTELIKDYVATELLSSIELDFLEGELWETTQHIAEINTVFKSLILSFETVPNAIQLAMNTIETKIKRVISELFVENKKVKK